MNTIRIIPRNYSRLINLVVNKGSDVTAGGKVATRELHNFHGVLMNPLDRIVVSDVRRMNFPFGVLEWIGLITGESRVSTFAKYISSYSRFSSDGVVVDGAYGERLQSFNGDQVEAIISKLQEDPQSRQAVVSIYHGGLDLFYPSKNTPCTLNLQYLIRNGQLIAITTMRSNDVVWGLSYDMFMFTMLQEYIARRLNVELGPYFHNAGSLHVYEHHWDIGNRMSEEKRWTRHMKPMPLISKVDMLRLNLLYSEPDGNESWFWTTASQLSCEYLQDLAFAARAFVLRSSKSGMSAYSRIEDMTIRKVMRPWLKAE